jgi:hypothetical protein
MCVRSPSDVASAISGIAAISGKKALYRHRKSIQSSSNPMKPPNNTQTANVKVEEMLLAG